MEAHPIRVYVAGAYSADNVLDVLHNIRRGIRMSTKLFIMGYAPFSPWLDYHFLLQVSEEEAADITVEMFYQYSIAWLAVADALLVLPNSESSVGTQREITKAKELGIPIFYHIRDLQVWRGGLHDHSGG
jgi:hypothetical protein